MKLPQLEMQEAKKAKQNMTRMRIRVNEESRRDLSPNIGPISLKTIRF